MQTADGNDALQHIRLLAGIRLMQHSLVAGTVGAGFVGIDAGDDQDLILYLFLQRDQTVDIIHYAVLAVGRTGADNHHQPMIASVENGAHFLHPCCSHSGNLFGERKFLFNVHGNGQLPNESGILLHSLYSLLVLLARQWCFLFYCVPYHTTSAIFAGISRKTA